MRYFILRKNMKDKKLLLLKNLRFIGILLLVVALFIFLVNSLLLSYKGYYFVRSFSLSIVMIPLDIAMILCPGAYLSPEETMLRYEGDAMKLEYFHYIWQKAPLFHKIVWIISLLVGVMVSLNLEHWVSVIL